MGTQLIIELDILRHAFAVALLRGVLPAVRLLFFEGSKKRFGDRIVMGPCCSGKGLLLAPGAHSQFGSGKNTQFEPEQRANPFENVFSKTAVFPPPAIAETDL